MKRVRKITDTFSFYCQAILYFLLALLPLVVYAVPYDTSHIPNTEYGGKEHSLDLFLKAKGILFLVLAIGSFLLASMLLLKEKQGFLKHKKQQEPNFETKQQTGRLCIEQVLFGIYALLCLLSYLLSDNKQLGISGAIEQNETILVLLGYAAVGYSFSILIQRHNLFPTICKALSISCLLLITVSLFQFFSHDLLQYSLVQALVLPSKLRETGIPLVLQSDVDTSHRVYATLYNPNYLGVYGNLVLPILFFFLAKTKKSWKKAILLVELFLFFCILLLSGSKTFLIVFVLQLILVGIVLIFRARHFLSIMTGLSGGLFLIFLSYTGFSGNQPITQLKTALAPKYAEGNLEDIQIQENNILIKYGDYELLLTFSIKEKDSWIQVLNSNGTELDYQINQEGTFCSKKPELSELYFYAGKMEERYICVAMIDGIPWYFSNEEKGRGYVFLTPSGKETIIQKAPEGLPGYERLASGRGYIWSKSIPLLKNNLLLGQGPETFLLQFPQNDYVAAAKAGYYNIIVSRPHNAYLQIGIQTGVLSLLVYVFCFLVYALRTSISLWKKKKFQKNDWIRVSILISLIGYMICMLVNDSLVVTAPLYWVLLGCGIGLNQNVESKPPA